MPDPTLAYMIKIMGYPLGLQQLISILTEIKGLSSPETYMKIISKGFYEKPLKFEPLHVISNNVEF